MSEEPNAVVSASIGDLEVEVEAKTIEDAEETFERVWQRRLDETHKMGVALKTLTRGFE